MKMPAALQPTLNIGAAPYALDSAAYSDAAAKLNREIATKQQQIDALQDEIYKMRAALRTMCPHNEKHHNVSYQDGVLQHSVICVDCGKTLGEL